MKPVGQIILGIGALAGATSPEAVRRSSAGTAHPSVTEERGDAKASVEYVLGMTDNVYAIRTRFSGIKTPVWLRLFRHRDVSHLVYMTPDGKYKSAAAKADKAFNETDRSAYQRHGRPLFLLDPPEISRGKNLANGFEYVLMGVVTTPGEGGTDLGGGKNRFGHAVDPILQCRGIGLASQGPRSLTRRRCRDSDVHGAGGTGKLEALVTIIRV